MQQTPYRTRSGFTLIELLVVISIIALLIGILLPVLAGARETARASACLSKVRSLVQATAMYGAENDEYVMPFSGKAPTTNAFAYWHYGLIPRFLQQSAQNFTTAQVQQEYLTCPSDELAFVGATAGERDLNPSYGYNVEMGRAWVNPATNTLQGAGVGRVVRRQSAFLSPTELVLFGDSWHPNENPAVFGGNRPAGGIRSSGIHFMYNANFSYAGTFKAYRNTVINGTRHNEDSGNVGYLDGHAARVTLEDVKTLSADPTLIPAVADRQEIWDTAWGAAR